MRDRRPPLTALLRVCQRSGCGHPAAARSDFCSRLCEHRHLLAIERTAQRETVETGELITGHAYRTLIGGGIHRANLQNSA